MKHKRRTYSKCNNWNNFITCKLQLSKEQLLLVVEITQLMIFVISLSLVRDVSLQVLCNTGKLT